LISHDIGRHVIPSFVPCQEGNHPDKADAFITATCAVILKRTSKAGVYPRDGTLWVPRIFLTKRSACHKNWLNSERFVLILKQSVEGHRGARPGGEAKGEDKKVQPFTQDSAEKEGVT
jgi:hypothetical protein